MCIQTSSSSVEAPLRAPMWNCQACGRCNAIARLLAIDGREASPANRPQGVTPERDRVVARLEGMAQKI